MQEEHIEAFKHELELRKKFLHSIDRGITQQRGNPAAEWRLRKKRSQAIDNRLSEIGQFARLSCGSLLVGLNNQLEVDVPVRYSNWRDTLTNSLVFARLSLVESGQLTGAPHRNYTRLESALQSLGAMICLSVRDIDDKSLIRSYWELKLYCIKNAFASDLTCDKIIEYLKWLGKTAQAVFLRTKCPEPSRRPFTVGGGLAPFAGPLDFISNFYFLGRRNRKLTTSEARACAQIANLPRSLPYPSRDQAKESIRKSVEIFCNERPTDAQALEEYRIGLIAQETSLRPLTKLQTHVSMVGNGVLEKSRSKGGRSKVLITAARQFTDLLLDFDEIKPLINKIDQFGFRILRSETVELAEELVKTKVYLRCPTLGDILYVKVDELAQLWETNLQVRSVPRELGNILNLAASILITEIGCYEPSPKWTLGIMYFERVIPKFRLQSEIRVRAGASVEAGLKTRLTTSGSAAYAHLSQLPANLLRDHLSKDPFMKIGFQESEKFWELLKRYEKSFAKP